MSFSLIHIQIATETVINICVYGVIITCLSVYVYTKHVSKYGIHVHVYINIYTHIYEIQK